MTEKELTQHIKGGTAGLYVLYGEESYLTEQYARLIAKHTVDEDFDAFNLQRFDGQHLPLEQLQEAVESLPMMADRKCVLVRDFDCGGSEAERLLTLIGDIPDSCVLVFWQMTVQPDKRKKGWKTFLDTAEKIGTVVRFERKTAADAAKMLVSGAKRRGCALDTADALTIVEMVGSNLQLLTSELDKLCALAVDGVITRAVIDAACTRNLEAKVFDLSKMILTGDGTAAYALLGQLFAAREEPVSILGVLSGAYADLYRAMAARNAGIPADSLAADFKGTYKGKEWRLRNAARTVSRLSTETLRDCVAILADADTALKSGRGDGRILLEQTVARLLERGRRR